MRRPGFAEAYMDYLSLNKTAGLTIEPDALPIDEIADYIKGVGKQ